MKLIKLLIVTLGVFFYGCAYQGNAPIRISENIKPESNDEKHELIVLDPGFETWFLTNAKPVSYHSLHFYETQNSQYVSAWNAIFNSSGGRGPIQNRIEYDRNENYGLEVNHKLYWYFKFVESRFGPLKPV